MAVIPGKQVSMVGRMEDLQERLSEREIGICLDDPALYFKLRGRIYPAAVGGGGGETPLPSALVASALNEDIIEGDDLQNEFEFEVAPIYVTGSDIWVDTTSHRIQCNPGLYHVDASVMLRVTPLEPRIDSVSVGVYDGLDGATIDIDRSSVKNVYFAELRVSGEINVTSVNPAVDIGIESLGTGVSSWLYYIAVYKIGDAQPDDPEQPNNGEVL